ncbi:MAG TPA: N-acetylmuramoyl-L-alanine amidase, partial [Methylobacter sp.]
MEKKWIGCTPDNFRKGRPAGLKPDIIVLHSLEGSLTNADTRCNSSGVLMSLHYAMNSKGEIHQYVDEQNTAFHAGLVVNPSASLLKARPNTNPNFFSIGIGLEGNAGESWTEAQYVALSTLLREIADRWTIPLDNDHVVPHSAIRASLLYPGSGADIERLLSNAIPNDQAQSIGGKEVMSLSNVNVRSRASVTAPVLRVLAASTKIKIANFVVGESVKGNSYWYQDEEGSFLWAGATDRPTPYALQEPTDTANTDTMVLPAPAAPAIASIPINRAKFRLPAGQFYTERPKKDLIVLHFTAGTSAKSAFDTWLADPQHIATAYIIDTDGVIYEVFDPTQWAFHLGVKGSNGRFDKRS